MKEKWDINCIECGAFILTEERRSIGDDIKCVAGSYENGFYDAEKDEFHCLTCSLKNKEMKQ